MNNLSFGYYFFAILICFAVNPIAGKMWGCWLTGVIFAWKFYIDNRLFINL